MPESREFVAETPSKEIGEPMAIRRGKKLLSALKAVEPQLALNKQFLQDVMRAIEKDANSSSRVPSEWYKPSGLGCIRSMYYTRMKVKPDNRITEYNVIGMGDTGTRRHEAIQDVLLKMFKMGYDWEYLDVEEYVKKQQKLGFCNSIVVKRKRGVETHLLDTTLNLSFMCDGIIRQVSTNRPLLFEFKNQTSFKYNKDTVDTMADTKQHVDLEHRNQVIAYCTALNLDHALVMYEHRDLLHLECPELFEVTKEMKQGLVNYIMECEGYVERMIPPPKPENVKCQWCNYRSTCRRDK